MTHDAAPSSYEDFAYKMAYTELVLREPLYHFTDVHAFKIIASTGKMRFSRADQTNDPYEFSVVRDKLIEQLEGMSVFDDKNSNYWSDIARSYVEGSDPSKFYLSCFSSRNDSLPMWRLYAEEGTGVVFGLRPKAFSSFDGRLTQVEYHDGYQGLFEHVRKYTARSLGEHLDTKHDTELIPYVVRLIEATTSTKRKQWDYEREIRLSFSYNRERYESIKDLVDQTIFERLSKLEPTKVDFSDDRQYLFQKFGVVRNGKVDRTGAIHSLVLGPNCSWSVEEASDFLSNAGYKNFDVIRSDVAWR